MSSPEQLDSYFLNSRGRNNAVSEDPRNSERCHYAVFEYPQLVLESYRLQVKYQERKISTLETALLKEKTLSHELENTIQQLKSIENEQNEILRLKSEVEKRDSIIKSQELMICSMKLKSQREEILRRQLRNTKLVQNRLQSRRLVAGYRDAVSESPK